MILIVTLLLKSDGSHISLFTDRDLSPKLQIADTLLRGCDGDDSSPEDRRSGPRPQALSVRLAGGGAVAGADGAVDGGEHQPAGCERRRAGGATGVPHRGGGRAAGRVHVRAAVPVLPAL